MPSTAPPGLIRDFGLSGIVSYYGVRIGISFCRNAAVTTFFGHDTTRLAGEHQPFVRHFHQPTHIVVVPDPVFDAIPVNDGPTINSLLFGLRAPLITLWAQLWTLIISFFSAITRDTNAIFVTIFVSLVVVILAQRYSLRCHRRQAQQGLHQLIGLLEEPMQRSHAIRSWFSSSRTLTTELIASYDCSSHVKLLDQLADLQENISIQSHLARSWKGMLDRQSVIICNQTAELQLREDANSGLQLYADSLRDELTSCKNRIPGLEGQLADLTIKLSNEEEACINTAKEIELKQGQLEAKEARIQLMLQDLGDLHKIRTERDEFRARLESGPSEVERLLAEPRLRARQPRLEDETERRARDTPFKVLQLRGDIRARDGRISKLESDLRALHESADQGIADESARNATTIENQSQAISQLQIERDTVLWERAAIQDKYQCLERLHGVATQRIINLESTLERDTTLEQQVKSLGSELDKTKEQSLEQITAKDRSIVAKDDLIGIHVKEQVRLQALVNDISRERARYQLELQNLQAILDESIATRSQYELKIQDLEVRIQNDAEQASRLKVAAAESAKAKNEELEAARLAIVVLEEKLTHANSQVFTFQGQLYGEQNKMPPVDGPIEATVKRLEDEVSDLSMELEAEKAFRLDDQSHATGLYNQLWQSYDSQSRAGAHLTAQLSESQTTAAHLSTQLDTARRERAAINSAIEDARKLYSELEAKFTYAQMERDGLQTQLKQMEGQRQSQLQGSYTQNADLELQIELDQMIDQKEKLWTRLKDAERECAEAIDAAQMHEAAAKCSETVQASLQAELDTLRGQNRTIPITAESLHRIEHDETDADNEAKMTAEIHAMFERDYGPGYMASPQPEFDLARIMHDNEQDPIDAASVAESDREDGFDDRYGSGSDSEADPAYGRHVSCRSLSDTFNPEAWDEFFQNLRDSQDEPENAHRCDHQGEDDVRAQTESQPAYDDNDKTNPEYRTVEKKVQESKLIMRLEEKLVRRKLKDDRTSSSQNQLKRKEAPEWVSEPGCTESLYANDTSSPRDNFPLNAESPAAEAFPSPAEDSGANDPPSMFAPTDSSSIANITSEGFPAEGAATDLQSAQSISAISDTTDNTFAEPSSAKYPPAIYEADQN